MKEQKFKLGKRRIDKLCKRFGLNVKFQHSRTDSYKVSYYCEG